MISHKSSKSPVIIQKLLLQLIIILLLLFIAPKVHASSGWQMQELWHTPVQSPSQLGLIGGNCDGEFNASDLTYSSNNIYGTFMYRGICSNQPPNLTYGFNSTTGNATWRQNEDLGWQAPLVADGIAVIQYASKWTGSVHLYGYNAINDQIPVLWDALGREATIDNNGNVFTQLGNNINSGPAGSIASYNLQSGQVNWQYDNACNTDNNPKIEVYNGVVYYIGCSNNDGTYAIQARDTTNGNLIWSNKIDSSFSTYGILGLVPSSNSTLISNGSIYTVTSNTDGTNNPTISSFKTSDGTKNWSESLSDTPSSGCACTFIGQIIAAPTIVYVLEDINYNQSSSTLPTVDIYALDASTGNEHWHKSINVNINVANLPNTGNSNYHGTLVNGVLYFNFGSTIYAFDAASGNQLMMDDTIAVNSNRQPISTPLVVGNNLYMSGKGENGQFTLFAYKILNNAPTPTPTPPKRQIVFVHGVKSSFRDIKFGTGGFKSLLVDNIGLPGNGYTVNFFSYYQDKGYFNPTTNLCNNFDPMPTPDENTGILYVPTPGANNRVIDQNTCDSQSAAAYNATKLDDELSGYTSPVAIINYSMGATITRGWLTLAQKKQNDPTLNKVDTIISIQGAQQGSYLAQNNLPLVNATEWSAPIWDLIKAATFFNGGFDLSRPAASDLTPESPWYATANTTDVPGNLHYFNFYSNIQLNPVPQFLTKNLQPLQTVSVGDGALLPGDPNPVGFSIFGGARFLPGGTQTKDKHEYQLQSIHDVKLGEILYKIIYQKNPIQTAEAIYTDPINHLNLNNNLASSSANITSCKSPYNTITVQDEIINILNDPAHACD